MLVHIRILIALFITLFFEIYEAQAVGNRLDLHGDGNLSQVDLPFTYYPRSSSPPKFTVVSQGAYAEYTKDESQPSTWIIGPLDPCIGIMIGNLRGCIAFHFHWSNDLEDMGKKINMHFSKDKDSLFARIFTVKNDRDWKKRKDNFAYGVKTHKEVVIKIKDYLVSSGILRERITAQMYTPPEPAGDLGLYTYARTWITMTPEEICINLGKTVSSSKDAIPLFSIDPCAEDIYDLKNQYFSPRDIWGEQLPLETEKQRRTSLEKCKFSNLPPDFKRLIYYKRLNQMEEALYRNYFSLDNPATLFTFTDQEIRGIRPFMRVNLNIN